MTLSGIDVSNNNGRQARGNPIDWSRARVGLDFVIIKATQGTTFQDSEYEYNRDGCGLPNGPYHWLEPAEAYGVPNEIVDQVKLLKRKVGTLGNDSIIATLDVENTSVGGGRRSGNPSPNDVALAIDVCEQEFGHTPMVYGGQPVLQPCAKVRWEITRAKFWKAIYPGLNDGNIAAALVHGYGTIDPWASLTMWQWTSSGAIDGAHGRVDMNILYAPLTDILVGAPVTQGRRKMWTLKPPWAPIVGGRSDHFRVIDAGGVAVLQGQGACTVTEVQGDPHDPDKRWSAPLGAPIEQVTGFCREDDWSVLYVTFEDWHTFEFHTGESIQVAGPKGDKGDKGDNGWDGVVDPLAVKILAREAIKEAL